MSGIEVAGLVLGAFPVVVSALEGYRNVFVTLKSWWKFQRTFEDFIDDVGTQRALFDNNIEKLLAPFVESESQMGLLLADPFGAEWHNPELDVQLRIRLGPSFHFYKSIVSRMNETLLDLQRILGINSGQAVHLWSERKPGRIEAELELRRMRISFSKQKFNHLEMLSKRNDELSKLLQSNDDLAPMRRKRLSSPDISFLQQLRGDALSIHGVLNSAWSCACEAKHVTHLRLEKRVVQKTVMCNNWKIVVASKDENAVQLSATELEVTIEGGDNVPENASKQEHTRDFSELGTVIDPRQDFAQRVSWLNVSESATVTSTENIEGSQALKPSFVTVRRRVPLKKVSFVDCSASIDGIIRIPSAAATNARVPPQPITDMCAAIKSIDNDTTCLGCIKGSGKRQHTFYPMSANEVKHQLTLTTALRPASDAVPLKVMNRHDRFAIAATLASSLLQIHTTPWLGQQWSKNDIVLYADIGQQRIVPKPSLQAEFPLTTDANASNINSSGLSRFNTKKALSNLGIMLLELCFGKAVEDHPLRPQFLGPNNQPNAFTDICTAREWHEDVLGELGDDMSDAIRRCLDCSFAPKPNFEDKEFQEAVFQGVVLPLQDVVKVWEKT